ncbi:MAG: branched-chain amino acid aminotransferase [Candidatus Eisenbacteria bacterium]
MEIAVQTRPERSAAAEKALEQKLGFGNVLADEMFMMHYTEGRGWHDAAIKPYAPISLDPSAMVFHYGQEIFEGHKAYRWDDGRVAMFRPDQNAARLNRSAERMMMPAIPEAFQVEVATRLVQRLQDWVPTQEGASLYLRPTMIATETGLGVRPSKEFLYFVICSPVGPYYPTGFKPVKVRAEDKHVRAVIGGTGAAKTGGNYAAGLYVQRSAFEAGYAGVLWLDGQEHKYVEEIGAMNFMVVMDGKLVTAPLLGSILPGITRASVLHMAPDMGVEAEERRISIDEVLEGIKSGRVTEAFGVGTAAVVTPIGTIAYKGEDYVITGDEVGPMAQKIHKTLTDIQWGRQRDPYGWMKIVVE